MREIGQILGYKDPNDSIGRLYLHHKEEFDNDCTQLVYIGGAVNTPPNRERLFSLEGLILICMFSEQPIAVKVRKWLRKLARQVATDGYYIEISKIGRAHV